MPASDQVLRIGSRDSVLALWQSRFVRGELERTFPNRPFELVSMSTIGDRMLDLSLAEIGEKSLFTKELESALEAGEVDLVVHSLKDVPTTLPPGMVLGAIGEREDPRDAVIFARDSGTTSLEELAPGSRVGTSAPRRVSQLQRLHPHLEFVSVRGNLNTRFQAVDTGKVSAIILAVAGLKRLGLADRISYALDPEDCMYAVGQAAVAVECRASDSDTLAVISTLTHPQTALRVIAERAFMKAFGGGCNIPVAAVSEIKAQTLVLKGGIFALNGGRRLVKTVSVDLPEMEPLREEESSTTAHYSGIVVPLLTTACLVAAEHLGIALSEHMIREGAKGIVEEAKRQLQNVPKLLLSN